MQHQEASEKCPKAVARMPVSGRNVCHPPENIQRLPREARKVDVAPGSQREKSKSRSENACQWT